MRNTTRIILISAILVPNILLGQLVANNEMTAFPAGWEEPQFVAQGTEFQYQINFQNNLGELVQDVVIYDVISEALDLESFQPITSSHPYELVINPVTREIRFDFININLNTMSDDLIGSAGSVSFGLTCAEGISHDTPIANHAVITFDGIEIETNTCERTIFDCDEVVPFVLTDIWVCEGDEIQFGNGYPYLQDQTWYLDGAPVATGSFYQQNFEDPGYYDVTLEISNPICSATSSHEVAVKSIPEASFFRQGMHLVANNASEYQWYWNGLRLEGETNSTLIIAGDGYYSVEVTNESGCSAVSVEAFITATDISYIKPLSFNLYPNPASDQVKIESDFELEQVLVYDMYGKVVMQEMINGPRAILDLSTLSSGSYLVRASDAHGTVRTMPLMVQR